VELEKFKSEAEVKLKDVLDLENKSIEQEARNQQLTTVCVSLYHDNVFINFIAGFSFYLTGTIHNSVKTIFALTLLIVTNHRNIYIKCYKIFKI
jgi:hypothetical protein